ncbi:MAG: FTR1 family iron permease [Thermoproteota archaeon]
MYAGDRNNGRLPQKDTEKRTDQVIWLGSGIAVLTSIALSVIFWAIYGFVENFVGLYFEVFTMFTAATVLTYMIFWMAKNARKIGSELQEKVEVAIASEQLLGISGLAFFSVLREGVEIILFLSASASISFIETIIGAISGITAATIVATFLIRGTVRLDWRRFFLYTSSFLLLFASGILMHGIQELQELGTLPPIIERVYDTSAILPEESVLGSLLYVFVGYQEAPSLLAIFLQFVYLIIFGTYLYKVYKSVV